METINSKLEDIYLPFTEQQLIKHFEHSKKYIKWIEKYRRSIKKYRIPDTNNSISETRQIEKDETFWTASTLMTIYHGSNFVGNLKTLLVNGFTKHPPIANISRWDELLGEKDNWSLYFEVPLPAPKEYKNYLRNNITKNQFIPYILESARHKTNNENRKNLEGSTHVDALLINNENGFSIMIEAKVLSDISYGVTYDTKRNQIIRNLDVLLEKYEGKDSVLSKRDPDKTLFILLTPEIYTKRPYSRLYAYKYYEYKENLNMLIEELEHRKPNFDLEHAKNLSDRIGWLTWEDFKKTNPNCCNWVK